MQAFFFPPPILPLNCVWWEASCSISHFLTWRSQCWVGWFHQSILEIPVQSFSSFHSLCQVQLIIWAMPQDNLSNEISFQYLVFHQTNSFSLFTLKICYPLQLMFIPVLPIQTVSLWGSSGRMEVTASKFMDIQRAIQPDWFQCISDGDTISGEAGRKRAKKSVDRSLSFLDICLQLQEKSPVRSPKYWGNSTATAFWSVLRAGPAPGCDLVGNCVTCVYQRVPSLQSRARYNQ